MIYQLGNSFYVTPDHVRRRTHAELLEGSYRSTAFCIKEQHVAENLAVLMLLGTTGVVRMQEGPSVRSWRLPYITKSQRYGGPRQAVVLHLPARISHQNKDELLLSHHMRLPKWAREQYNLV